MRDTRRLLSGKNSRLKEIEVNARQIADALMYGSSRLLREVRMILQSEPPQTESLIPEEPEDMTDGTYERLRIESNFGSFVHAREVEELCFSETELCNKPGYSRDRVEKLRRDGRLLAFCVAYRAELHYPLWQFDDHMQPLPAIWRFTTIASEIGLTPRTLNSWMTSETRTGDRPPLERLREEGGEEEVIQRLRDSQNI